jgi:hypothetical protein
MARVEATLEDAARSQGAARGVLPLAPEGDAEVNVGRLRHAADIDIEFPSGSDRPLVGGAIRLAKRVVRRGLRWYLSPIVDQQTRFNHAALDLIERLRLRVARLDAGERVTVPTDGPAGRRPPLAEDGDRLPVYLPLLRGRRRVVDVDCESGDLLEALRREGVGGYGVSFDEAGVGAVTGEGIEMVLDDPVEHLRRLPPGSVDGVFASLVASPRSGRQLVALLSAAAHAVADGGVVVVESTDVGAQPRPGRPAPLHPEAVAAAFQVTGFSEVRGEVVTPRLEPLATATDETVLGRAIERIDDVCRRGTTAIVATKPGPGG